MHTLYGSYSQILLHNTLIYIHTYIHTIHTYIVSIAVVVFIVRKEVSLLELHIDRCGFLLDLTDAGQSVYAVAILLRSVKQAYLYVCTVYVYKPSYMYVCILL